MIPSGLMRATIEFLRNEDGPTAVEYAVQISLVIVLCLNVVTSLGGGAKQTFTKVGNTLNTGS